jgi:hypothetical protein
VIGRKLILNSSANGPAVVFQMRMGELASARPEFIRAILEEGHRVIMTPGVERPAAALPPADQFVDGVLNAFSTKYAEHPTSMGADFANGKTLETQYISHGMSREGREVGVPTPLNDMIARRADEFYNARKNGGYGASDDVDAGENLRFRQENQALLEQADAEARQLLDSLKLQLRTPEAPADRTLVVVPEDIRGAGAADSTAAPGATDDATKTAVVSSAERPREVIAGQTVFSTNDSTTGFVAESVTKEGTTLVFENFTVAATDVRHIKGRMKGLDLLAPAKQLLKFGEANGATAFRFEGSFLNPDLAAKFGMKAGDEFSFTVEANRAGVIEMLRKF